MHNKSVKGRRGIPTDHEKILCDLKDLRQHGLIKKRHTLTKLSQRCISKVKEPWRSSVTSADAIPTLVINSRVVLIGRLICQDEGVYEEMIFCKTSLSVKVNCHFPSQNNRTCTKLT